MATSLRLLFRLGKSGSCQSRVILSCCKRAFSQSPSRLLLSETYSCNEAWRKHMEDSNLSEVSLSEFGYQVRDQLEKSGSASAVDVNVLAHQLSNMDDDEADFIEDIIARYNMSQSSVPRNESTTHAFVRGFLSMKRDGASRLVRLLSERLRYGLFPDQYSLNLLIDRLVEAQDWAGAARVAYHTMLQEDLGSCRPLHTLLCLHAAVQRLLQGPVSDLALPPVEKVEDEEEDWIKVKYIKFPIYDDHFDIKDERFLLGKTLYMLSHVQNVDIPEDVRNSLSVIGSGIHHKFSQGLDTLDQILSSSSQSSTVSQFALDQFSESLGSVEARDNDEPEVELALRTVDDVIHRLLPTIAEKEDLLTRFGQIKEKLASQGRVHTDFDLGQSVTSFVTSRVSDLESADVEDHMTKLARWQQERAAELARQVEALRQSERLEEMREQVRELQEKEELLSYFDFEEKIRLTFLDEDQARDEGITIAK